MLMILLAVSSISSISQTACATVHPIDKQFRTEILPRKKAKIYEGSKDYHRVTSRSERVPMKKLNTERMSYRGRWQLRVRL